MSNKQLIQLPYEINQVRVIFNRALGVSYRWWVDELDCSKSWCRKPTNKTFTDILDMIDKEMYYATCILRTGYGDENNHYQFALNTFGDVNYFIWIEVLSGDLGRVIYEGV